MIAEVLGREHAKRFSDSNHPKPIMFGKHQHKLGLVQESGVERKFVKEAIDEGAFNGVSQAHAGKYDVVVDATGSPAGLKLAAGMCRPMGTLVSDAAIYLLYVLAHRWIDARLTLPIVCCVIWEGTQIDVCRRRAVQCCSFCH